VSIYGTNLASATATWTGNFPASLRNTSVTINGRSAYLWLVSPTQINLQAPDDTATGTVAVVVTTGSGNATSTVTRVQFAPSFSLLDNKHVTGITIRSDGSGAYGGGTYDIIGPTGNSLGYATVAARAGDTIELYGVGFGPTSPTFPAGQAIPAGAPGTATNPIHLAINGTTLCLGAQAKCGELYVKQEALERAYEAMLRRISVDEDIVNWIASALRQSHADLKRFRDQAVAKFKQEHLRLQNRLGTAPPTTNTWKLVSGCSN